MVHTEVINAVAEHGRFLLQTKADGVVIEVEPFEPMEGGTATWVFVWVQDEKWGNSLLLRDLLEVA